MVAQAAARILERQALQALRVEARNTADSAYTAAFRLRAREMGGVTPKTRDHIVAQARAAANAAWEAVYLAHGYHRCPDPWQGGCTRLVSPGYLACPFCTMKGD